MPAHRVKIEFFDKEGIKHTMAIEGHVTKEKIGKILDYIELMGGIEGALANKIIPRAISNRFEKTLTIILSQFPGKSFTSKEVQQSYKSLHEENIPLSTISTYLSRLAERGVLTRTGSSFEWKYVIRSIDSEGNSSIVKDF